MRARAIAWSAVAVVMLSLGRPAAGQDVIFYDAVSLPLPAGFTSSEARGIARQGLDPVTVAGTMDGKASCWVRVSQVWQAHELPELAAGAGSWANAVGHAPASGGEWTLAVGVALDGTGTEKPVRWDNTTGMPWSVQPLPTLSAGDGAAHTIFVPDGTPLRALVGGWCGETTPVAAEGATAAGVGDKSTPIIWQASTGGSNLVRPDFGAGLEGHVNDIGTGDMGGFLAVGGGQDAAGSWLPQLWTSTDDGDSWANDQLPLPPTTTDGEAVHLTSTGGITLVAGWGETPAGATVPLLWELDPDDPTGTWIIHELPVPTGHEVAHNMGVHGGPGGTTYVGTLTPTGGAAEVTLWIDDLAGGWNAFGPSDYLVNPEVGTPTAAAGIDAFGVIAATLLPAPPARGVGTVAGVLAPVGGTGVPLPDRPPRQLIRLSASPNPFTPNVRIAYTLPRDARVTVTVHDLAGRQVARLADGHVPAGAERVARWDGKLSGGKRATSGVYFVRVATSYEISMVKVVKLE